MLDSDRGVENQPQHVLPVARGGEVKLLNRDEGKRRKMQGMLREAGVTVVGLKSGGKPAPSENFVATVCSFPYCL